MQKLKSILWISVVALMMTACSASDDVSQWLAQQKAANQPTPSDWEGLKLDDIVVKPERYQSEGLLSPMNQRKLYTSIKPTEFPLCIQQQIDRKQNRPEPLESYPLNTLKAVGYIKESVGKRAMALIQVGEHQIFEAYIGHYVGFDYGRITGISETEVYITETMYLPGSDVCEERDITLNIYGGVNQ